MAESNANTKTDSVLKSDEPQSVELSELNIDDAFVDKNNPAKLTKTLKCGITVSINIEINEKCNCRNGPSNSMDTYSGSLDSMETSTANAGNTLGRNNDTHDTKPPLINDIDSDPMCDSSSSDQRVPDVRDKAVSCPFKRRNAVKRKLKGRTVSEPEPSQIDDHIYEEVSTPHSAPGKCSNPFDNNNINTNDFNNIAQHSPTDNQAFFSLNIKGGPTDNSSDSEANLSSYDCRESRSKSKTNQEVDSDNDYVERIKLNKSNSKTEMLNESSAQTKSNSTDCQILVSRSSEKSKVTNDNVEDLQNHSCTYVKQPMMDKSDSDSYLSVKGIQSPPSSGSSFVSVRPSLESPTNTLRSDVDFASFQMLVLSNLRRRLRLHSSVRSISSDEMKRNRRTCFTRRKSLVETSSETSLTSEYSTTSTLKRGHDLSLSLFSVQSLCISMDNVFQNEIDGHASFNSKRPLSRHERFLNHARWLSWYKSSKDNEPLYDNNFDNAYNNWNTF